MSVSIKLGGTAIPKPEEMADLNYLASTCECSHLIDVLKGKESFDPVFHTATMKAVREEMKKKKSDASDEVLKKIEKEIDKKGARRLNYLKEKGTGTWLAATPSFMCGTVLSTLEFRYELRDRYGMKILNAPSHCDGCTAEFSETHALDCKIGGLVHQRHDESRDTLGCLACAGFQPSNVRDKPYINPCREIGGNNDVTKLVEPQTGLECELEGDRGDLLIRGFWARGTDCVIDVRIHDVNQNSYLTRTPASILKSAEISKKKKYLEACLAQRRHFTPFAVSYECMLGKEVYVFLKRLSMKLAEKWHMPYSQTVSFVKTRFAISLVRAKNRCFRGSRIPTGRISHRVDWEDGTGLGLYSTLE